MQLRKLQLLILEWEIVAGVAVNSSGIPVVGRRGR
jgi:hypothetical protein